MVAEGLTVRGGFGMVEPELADLWVEEERWAAALGFSRSCDDG